MKVCQNPHCGEPAEYLLRGLCDPCYQYQLRTGRKRRPENRIRRGPPPDVLCSNCQQRPARFHRTPLCEACYQYQRRTGKPRPARLYRRKRNIIERCRICQRPRDTAALRFSRGRCATCANYYNRTGRERPRTLIVRYAPLGFCDCGAKATSEKVVTIRQTATVTLPLCDQCAAWEEEMAS